jgi:hypothetical protein
MGSSKQEVNARAVGHGRCSNIGQFREFEVPFPLPRLFDVQVMNPNVQAFFGFYKDVQVMVQNPNDFWQCLDRQIKADRGHCT